METTTAVAAFKRSVIGVNVHVHLESTALPKGVATYLAMERPFAGVGQQVFLVYFANFKRTPAIIALKWPLSAVHGTLMHVKMVLVVKLLWALVTLKWLLPKMNSHVNGALASSQKASVARLK